MLPGAGLGDDAPLAHVLRQQRLSQSVVDLVGSCVGKVLSLEVDASAAELSGQVAGEVQRRRPSRVVRVVVGEPVLEVLRLFEAAYSASSSSRAAISVSGTKRPP